MYPLILILFSNIDIPEEWIKREITKKKLMSWLSNGKIIIRILGMGKSIFYVSE